MSHFGSRVCYFFWKGQTSIFYNPYIENTAFPLPEGSKNEVEIDANMGTPNRISKISKHVPKVTPNGDPLGRVFAPTTVPETDPQKRP